MHRDCGCPALWLVEAVLLDLNPSVRARKLLSTETGYTIDDDPFIHIELMLASYLATSFGARAAQADQVLRDALVPPIDADTVRAAVKKMGEILGEPIDDSTQTNIEIYINDLITKGARDAQDASATAIDTTDDESDGEDNADEETDSEGNPTQGVGASVVSALLVTGLLARGISIEAAPEISKVFETMIDGMKFYSNNQINTVLIPSIDDAIEAWVQDNIVSGNITDSNGIPPITDLLENVNDQMDMDYYWRTLANASASRAYHYGLFKAGELFGQGSFTVVNPMDEKTSPICQYLNGMVFDLSDAVNQVEKLIGTSPEDIGDVTPFLTFDDVAGKTPDELVSLGVTTPPYHFNCRSWAVFSGDTSG
jgi:hypothetical protein